MASLRCTKTALLSDPSCRSKGLQRTDWLSGCSGVTAESDTTISSSAQFLEKLKGDLAIETIELLLQSKYDETENRLVRAQVLQLLKFCVRTYFTFDGTIYERVKGTPMGSPISVFIAEAVLQRLESLVFQHHKPKFWPDLEMSEDVVPEGGLLCAGCKRILNNPQTLICGHTFCKDPCLGKLAVGHGFVECPFCFVEMAASSVVADSVLAGRLRQYLIQKCKAILDHIMLYKVDSTSREFSLPPRPERVPVNPHLPNPLQQKTEGQSNKKKNRSRQRSRRNNRPTVNNIPGPVQLSTPTKELLEEKASPINITTSPHADPVCSRKIFVGGLNPQVTSKALQTQFARFGKVVDAIVFKDKKTGISKGYGYVTFDLPGTAEAVLTESNLLVCGSPVHVRKYGMPKGSTGNRVTKAPKTSRPSSPIRGKLETPIPVPVNTESPTSPRQVAATDEPVTCIYIGHLSPDVTRTHLTEYFRKYGKIEHVFVFQRRFSHAQLGFGFVYFAEASAVQEVLISGPHTIGTSKVLIRPISKDELLTENNFESKPCSHATKKCKPLDPSSGKIENSNVPCEDPVTDELMAHIFVEGLTPDITRTHLMQYFRKFGMVRHIVLDKQEEKYKTLGYGIVYFAEASAVQKVLTSGPHIIGTSQLVIRSIRKCEQRTDGSQQIKPCSPTTGKLEAPNPIPINTGDRPTTHMESATDEPMSCIYVSQLRPDVTRNQLMEYFRKFGNIEYVLEGKIERVPLPPDSAFVSFTEPRAVQKVLTSGPHAIGSSRLVIRPMRRLQANNNFRSSLNSNGLSSRVSSPVASYKHLKGPPATSAVPPVRCPNWLTCIWGDKCAYIHPQQDCRDKDCKRGSTCCFLHPEDKVRLESLRRLIDYPAAPTGIN
ncbi:hypothetical protein SprV_0200962800 [Sparganum proliferum]